MLQQARRPACISACAVIVMLAVCAPAAAESPPVKVTRMRTDTLTLFNEPNGVKKREVRREDLKEPWPVKGPLQQGFLPVEVGGEHYWVKGHLVETDRPIVASSECGARVTGAAPRQGATRNLGEDCKK